MLLALGRVELRPMGNDRGRDLGTGAILSGWWLTEGSLQKTYADILTHKGPKQREHTGMCSADLYCQNCVHRVCKPREMEAVYKLSSEHWYCIETRDVCVHWEMEP